METTWDMSPAKRKMFIVAASFPSFVRARGTLLVAGFSCFSLDPQSAAVPETRRWRRRSKNEGPSAASLFPRFTQSARPPRFCLLASVLPAASEVRVSVGQAGLIQSSAGGSGVRPGRPDAVQPGGSRASDGLQHY